MAADEIKGRAGSKKEEINEEEKKKSNVKEKRESERGDRVGSLKKKKAH